MNYTFKPQFKDKKLIRKLKRNGGNIDSKINLKVQDFPLEQYFLKRL